MIDQLLPGHSNERLRSYMKSVTESTWQLVNWLTHTRSATKTAATMAAHASDTVVGHFIALVERARFDRTEQCPTCKSRDVRSHFDPAIAPDGDYYQTCGACGWSSHPPAEEGNDDQ